MKVMIISVVKVTMPKITWDEPVDMPAVGWS